MTIRDNRSRLSGTRCGRPRIAQRRGTLTVVLAGLALVAQMLVATHAVHVHSLASAEAFSQSCAICVTGGSHVDLPTIGIAPGPCVGPWTVDDARADAPVALLLERALFPRAPPTAAPFSTTG